MLVLINKELTQAIVDMDIYFTKEKFMLATVNKELAQAIVDMDNIGYSEGLGAKADKGYIEWMILVKAVSKEFDLTPNCNEHRA